MSRNGIIVGITILALLILSAFTFGADELAQLQLPDVAQTFVTTYLGIFIEAVPFLLLGSFASGFVSEFVSDRDIARFIPRNTALATLVGAMIGIIFPVCECGVVPLVKRLYQKGLPTSSGIALLLGAPVLNPIVIASTYAAFGFGVVFWSRLGFTLLIAFAVGLIFANQPASSVLRTTILSSLHTHTHESAPSAPISERIRFALLAATDDFFEMSRYLLIGILLSTAMQTFVSQQLLLSIGTNAVLAIVALIALAYVLSVCSTVDAFLALSFVNSFPVGAIVAFLVFGPMIDIKSTAMFMGVYQRRVVLYLIALLALCALVVGLLF
jgi:uncharacterized membrane protein YraQ (UPF0718 family)